MQKSPNFSPMATARLRSSGKWMPISARHMFIVHCTSEAAAAISFSARRMSGRRRRSSEGSPTGTVGGTSGSGPFHSQSVESLYAHYPGLVVLTPATVGDAYWMLLEAITLNDPVTGKPVKFIGTSEKAVKSLIHRARESLREALSAFLEEEEAILQAARRHASDLIHVHWGSGIGRAAAVADLDVFRTELRLPEAIYELLSIYLLLAIGLLSLLALQAVRYAGWRSVPVPVGLRTLLWLALALLLAMPLMGESLRVLPARRVEAAQPPERRVAVRLCFKYFKAGPLSPGRVAERFAHLLVGLAAGQKELGVHLVVDLRAQEHDAIVEQARVDVVRALAAARRLDDHRDEHLGVAFVERFRYKASKAKSAQDRIKKIARIDRLDKPTTGHAEVRFGFRTKRARV